MTIPRAAGIVRIVENGLLEQQPEQQGRNGGR